MKNIFSSNPIVILTSILLCCFQSNSSFAQNYWERTPGPGTVIVYDFIFKDDFVLIGTWLGGMYKSTDAGETWNHLENEFSNKSVYSLELLPNGNILAGSGNGIHFSSDNGETWTQSSLTDFLVSTITLDDAGSIYVGSVYENNIYRSNDYGVNWTALNSDIWGIRSIVTKDINLIVVASDAGIYRSSDTGATWQNVLPPNQSINDLTLIHNGNFAAISNFGDFYISSDEGMNWDSISTINNSARIIFSSSNGDIYLGSYGVYRSTNEGISWTKLNFLQSSGMVRSIAENNNFFFAGTYFSGVFRSVDSGNNWSQSSSGINNSTISTMEKGLINKVYAISVPAGLSVTSDNGENWSVLNTMGPVTSFTASPNGTIFASSGGSLMGVILRSIDSGTYWDIILQVDSAITQVNVNLDNSVYAIINHKLFKSSNNGNDWFEIQLTSPAEFIKSVTFNNIGYIFCETGTGYFRSSDNGGNWEYLVSTPEGIVIFGITKTNEMYATASDSNFYRSTDFGNSWNSIYKSNGNAVKSFADDSEGNLFILLSGTGVLRSADNGISWQEINSGLDNVSLNNLIITDNDYILAGTSGEGVYKSVNKTTSLENSFAELPTSFLLEQNYPNPFNPTTNIRFKIAESGYVSLKIFDVLGNEIETLISGEKPSGDYEVKFDGRSLSSGIYFYQLRSGEIIQTKKMILIR